MKTKDKDKDKDIDIKDEISLHKLSWKLKKIGFAILIVLLILFILGFAGSGPLSLTESENNLFKLEYPLYTRVSLQEELTLSIKENSDTLKIFLLKDYVKNLNIESVVPEPEKQEFKGEYLVFYFNGKNPTDVILNIKFKRSGIMNSQVAVNNPQNLITLKHYILP